MTIAQSDEGGSGDETESDTEKVAEEDWAEIYTIFLCHTNLGYEEIERRTLPQLRAILECLPKHVKPNHTCPFFGGGGGEETETQESPEEPEREQTVEERLAFTAMFSGIR